MLGVVMKAAPAVLMVAGMNATMERLKPLLESTRGTATQFEVNEIAQAMRLDFIVDPESVPTPDNFPDYLRKNMKVNGASVADDPSGATPEQVNTIADAANKAAAARDVTKDQWGTPYKLERTGNHIRIVSAGPDKNFDTTDDIYAKRDLGG